MTCVCVLVDALTAQLFGRGWSSAPHTAYTIDLYVAQLALTMDAVGFAKANICGLSMVRLSRLQD